MNPYDFVRNTLPTTQSGDLAKATLHAVLTLMGAAYSSGFTRGPANNEYDYVVREVESTFGAEHPVTKLFQVNFAQFLGR